jgi:hypothetical protein
MLAGGPNWLGSPQHLVGGVGLALVVVVVARLRGFELRSRDKFHYSAYYDTLADMGSTLAGAIPGAIAGASLMRGRDPRERVNKSARTWFAL